MEGKSSMTVLIAEDDCALAIFLQRVFEADGHSVRAVSDGAEAVEVFRDECPDLTILDLNLPKKDGERALHEMRQLDADRPILILTGRTDVQSRVRCLEHGADDLILKPFSLIELRARCGALLRRRGSANVLLRADDLEVNRISRSVTRGGQNVNLTNKEFALLEQLLLSRGNCLSRSDLLQRVWKSESAQTTNIVDVYVNYLRRKLDDHPPGSLIRTLHGKGYMIPRVSGGTPNLQAAD
jgi:DNA-binding response OmpR family regulator